MQTLSQCSFRLEVHRRALLGDRVLEPGDVLDVNPVTGELFVAAGLPYNPTALRALLASGEAAPAEGTAPQVVARLGGEPRRERPSGGATLRLIRGDAQ